MTTGRKWLNWKRCISLLVAIAMLVGLLSTGVLAGRDESDNAHTESEFGHVTAEADYVYSEAEEESGDFTYESDESEETDITDISEAAEPDEEAEADGEIEVGEEVEAGGDAEEAEDVEDAEEVEDIEDAEDVEDVEDGEDAEDSEDSDSENDEEELQEQEWDELQIFFPEDKFESIEIGFVGEDLLEGVFALLGEYEYVDVYVVDDGGFDPFTAGLNDRFTVIYGAIHPQTEEVVTRERIVTPRPGIMATVSNVPSGFTVVNMGTGTGRFTDFADAISRHSGNLVLVLHQDFNWTNNVVITIPANRNIIITSVGTNLSNHSNTGRRFTITRTGSNTRHFRVNNGATLTISNITLTGDIPATSTSERGGIFVDRGGTLIMQNGSVIRDSQARNAANMGTLVAAPGSTTAQGGGGGVRVHNGTLIMEAGSLITNNRSSLGAGVRADTGSRVTMNGGEIRNNQVTDTGHAGGIQIEGSGSILTMNAGSISNNSAPARGGGVRVLGAEFNMHGGTISNNQNTASQFANASSRQSGGGVYVGTGTFNMYGGIIENNHANLGGGVAVPWAQATFNMYGGTIRNNVNSRNNNTTPIPEGGGVWVADGTFNMHRGEIVNNRAVHGGGVWVGLSGRFTMRGGTIHTNTATVRGGGVEIFNGIMHMHDGIIESNRAVRGAGISMDNGTLNMHGGTIRTNTATERGGGVEIFHGIVHMHDGIIESNRSVRGAGISLEAGTLNMHGGNIRNHNSSNATGGSILEGAGVRVHGSNSRFNMTGGLIDQNTADEGGGVWVSGGARFHMDAGGTGTAANPTSGTIARNDSTGTSGRAGGGGIMLISNGIFEMSAGLIEGNEAVARGGGINVHSSQNVRISGGIIRSNTVTGGSGGGLHMTQTSSAEMTGGEISGNTVRDNGGGVHAWNSTFTMRGGTISGNTAYGTGGGVNAGNGTFNMYGGTIGDSNTASNGGGVHIGNSAFNMRGGIISGNIAGSNGGGIYAASGGVFNGTAGSILGNTADDGGGLFVDHANLGNVSVEREVVFGNNLARNGLGFDNFLGQSQLYAATPIRPESVTVTDWNIIDEIPRGSGYFEWITTPHAFTNHDINAHGIFWRVTYEIRSDDERFNREPDARVGINNLFVPSGTLVPNDAGLTFDVNPSEFFDRWDVETRTCEVNEEFSPWGETAVRPMPHDVDAHTHVVGYFFNPDFEITKSVEYTAPLRIGDTVRYTISVENTGDIALTNLVVTDTLSDSLRNPALVGELPSDINGGFDGNVLEVTITNLAVGETVEISFTAIVADGAPIGDTIVNIATVSAPEHPELPDGTDEAETGEVYPALVYDFEITKSVEYTAPLRIGDTVRYTISVENTGDLPLTDLIVTDTLPDSLRNPTLIGDLPSGVNGDFDGNELSVTITNLAVGETVEIRFTAIVANGAPIGDTIVNIATVSAPEHPELPDSTDEAETGEVYPALVYDFEVRKSVSHADPLRIGDTVNYTIAVENTGDLPLTDLIVRDPLPNSLRDPVLVSGLPSGVTGGFTDNELEINIETLAVGQTMFIRFIAIVADGALIGDTIINIATVSAPEHPELPDDTDEVETGEVYPALVYDFEITKSVEYTVPLRIGDTVRYTISVENTGDLPLTDLVVTDTLPDSLRNPTLIGELPSGVNGDFDGNVLEVTITNLAVGETVEISFTAIVADGAPIGYTIVNIATVSAPEHPELPDSTDEAETGEVYPALVYDFEIAKSVEYTAPLRIGDTVRYTISVENTGDLPLTDLLVTDTLPDSLRNPTLIGELPSGVNGGFDGNVLEVTITNLAVGETVEISFTAIVADGAPIGDTIVNIATVSAPEHPELPDGTDEAETGEVYPALVYDFEIAKSVEYTAPLRIGDTVSYTISVENTGDLPLTDLIVTDTLPDSLRNPALIGELPSGVNGGFIGNDLSVNITSLAVGETVEIRFTAIVADGAPIGDTIINVATVSAPEHPELPDDTDEAETGEVYPALVYDFEITKSVEYTAPLRIGDTVRYTISVENTGDLPLTDLVVTDTLPDSLRNPTLIGELPSGVNGGFDGNVLEVTITSLAIGETVEISFAAIVADGAPIGYTIVNIATVSAPEHPELPDDTDEAETGEVYPALIYDFEITKSVEYTAPLRIGDTVRYTISVENTGDLPLTDLVVTDTLSDSLRNPTLIDELPSGVNGGFTGNDLSVTITNLAVGETVEIRFTAIVADGAPIGDTIVNIATVSAPEHPELPDDTDEAETGEVYPALIYDFEITKGVEYTAPLRIGDTVRYTISVENTGDLPLTDLVVTDTLPDSLRNPTLIGELPSGANGGFDGNVLEVTITSLAIGETVEISFTAIVADGAPIGYTIVNIATVSAPEHPELPDDTDEAETGEVYPALVYDFEITKSVEYTAPLRIGDTVRYTISVENTGDLPLTDLIVTDTLSDSLRNPTLIGELPSGMNGGFTGNDLSVNITSLAVGETVEIRFTAIVANGAPIGDTIVNVATVSAPEHPELPDGTDEAETGEVYPAFVYDFEITKSVEYAAPLRIGDTVRYTISVENTGDIALINLVVTDTLSDSLRNPALIDELPSGVNGGFTGNDLSVNITSLAIGETVEIRFTAIVADGAPIGYTIINIATVSAPEHPELPDGTDEAETGEVYPALVYDFEITKSVEYTAPLRIGDTVRYTISVENTGDLPLTDLIVTDTLPDSLRNPALIGELPNDMTGGFIGDELSVNITGLAIGETVEISFVAIVADGAPIGDTIVNIATVSAPEHPELPDDTDEAETGEVYPALVYDFEITKSVEYTAPLRIGDTVRYTISVENTGDLPLTDLVVTDTLPDSLRNPTLIGELPSGVNGGFDGNVLEVTITNLAVGETVEIRFTAIVADGAPIGDTIVNIATVSAPEHPELPDSTDEAETGEVYPALVYDFEVRKSVSHDDPLRVGGTVNYTITVENTGDLLLTNVVVTDTLPDSLRDPVLSELPSDVMGGFDGNMLEVTIANLAVGETVEISFTAIVSDSAPIGYPIRNVAVVSTPYHPELPDDEDEEYTGNVYPQLTHDFEIRKSASHDDPLRIGDTVHYTITVRNSGELPLMDLEVSDTLPNSLCDPVLDILPSGATGEFDGNVLEVIITNLAVGETVEIRFTAIVADDAPIGYPIRNVVIVSAPNYPELPDDEDEEYTGNVYPALINDFEVRKSVSHADPLRIGDTVYYTIAVENTGDLPLADLIVRDPLPNILRDPALVSGLPSGVTGGFTDNELEINIETLAVGQTMFIRFIAIVADSAPIGYPIRNVAVVSAPNNPELPDNEDEEYTGNVYPALVHDFEIRKSASHTDPLRIGDTVHYTIAIENTGDLPLTDLVVRDPLPNSLRNPVLVSGLPSGVTGGFTDNELEINIETLAIGQTMFIRFTAIVADDAPIGYPIRNVAVVSAPNYPELPDNEDEEYTGNVNPALTQSFVVEKTAEYTAPLRRGSTINYTIAVKNTGELPLTNLIVRDTLADSLRNPVLAELPYGTTGEFTNNTLVATIATLAVGETVEIKFTAIVADNAPIGAPIRNVAVVSAPNYPDIPGGRDEENTSNVQRPPSVPSNVTPQTPPDIIFEDPEIPLIPFAPTHYRYLIGDNYGLIRARDNITRAEVATIFFRLITDDFREQMWTQANPFSDVYLANWFNNGVSTMTSAEILRGMPDGSFEPNRGITRAEFATIVSRFVDLTYDGELRFDDIEGHWAQDYINLVGSLGWVIGMPNGDFEPNREITRAEAATIVNRVLIRHPETLDDLLDGRREWPDMTNQYAWYYIDLQEATNSNAHEMKECGIFKTWIELIPCPDWVALERPDSTPRAHRN